MRTLYLILLTVLLLFCFSSCKKDYYEISEKQKFSTEWNTSGDTEYIVNQSSRTYHLPSCYIAENIKEENKVITTDIDFLIERQYKPCKKCIDK